MVKPIDFPVALRGIGLTVAQNERGRSARVQSRAFVTAGIA